MIAQIQTEFGIRSSLLLCLDSNFIRCMHSRTHYWIAPSDFKLSKFEVWNFSLLISRAFSKRWNEMKLRVNQQAIEWVTAKKQKRLSEWFMKWIWWVIDAGLMNDGSNSIWLMTFELPLNCCLFVVEDWTSQFTPPKPSWLDSIQQPTAMAAIKLITERKTNQFHQTLNEIEIVLNIITVSWKFRNEIIMKQNELLLNEVNSNRKQTATNWHWIN